MADKTFKHELIRKICKIYVPEWRSAIIETYPSRDFFVIFFLCGVLHIIIVEVSLVF